MKTAKIKVVAVDVECPHCGAEIISPTGQIAWDVNLMEFGSPVTCSECGKQAAFPKTVKL